MSMEVRIYHGPGDSRKQLFTWTVLSGNKQVMTRIKMPLTISRNLQDKVIGEKNRSTVLKRLRHIGHVDVMLRHSTYL